MWNGMVCWWWRATSSKTTCLWWWLYRIRNWVQMPLYSLVICVMMILHMQAWWYQKRVRVYCSIIIMIIVVGCINWLCLICRSNCCPSCSRMSMLCHIYGCGVHYDVVLVLKHLWPIMMQGLLSNSLVLWLLWIYIIIGNYSMQLKSFL